MFTKKLSRHFCFYCYFEITGATTDEPALNNTAFGVSKTSSYPCPPGYYCLSGDIVPRACPNATYNSEHYASELSNCTLCEIDHFNHLTAQTKCFHCGGQASQPFPGQDICRCNGQHKTFMVSLINYLTEFL